LANGHAESAAAFDDAIDFPHETSEVEVAGFTTALSQVVKPPRLAEAHAALEYREYTTLEIGQSRIILGRVVSIYVEDRYVDHAGPYIKADQLHAIGRMNGLGNYVRTRDAFMMIPRVSYEEWKKGK
jgi:flavin reductase (DIM6/NTAB) family NADH-FMN oxidoreductase RutF